MKPCRRVQAMIFHGLFCAKLRWAGQVNGSACLQAASCLRQLLGCLLPHAAGRIHRPNGAGKLLAAQCWHCLPVICRLRRPRCATPNIVLMLCRTLPAHSTHVFFSVPPDCRPRCATPKWSACCAARWREHPRHAPAAPPSPPCRCMLSLWLLSGLFLARGLVGQEQGGSGPCCQ